MTSVAWSLIIKHQRVTNIIILCVEWTEFTLHVLEENTMHLTLISGYLLVIVIAVTQFVDWPYQTELKIMPSKRYQNK